MQRRLSNFDKIILAQPLTEEVKQIFGGQKRKQSMQRQKVKRAQSGNPNAYLQRRQEEKDKDTFFITNFIENYGTNPKQRIMPKSQKNTSMHNRSVANTSNVQRQKSQEQPRPNENLRITMEEFDSVNESDDLSQLSFELFHKNELEAIQKIQMEKKKIFFNEKIRTTNYVISSKFDRRNELLNEELEQAKKQLEKQNSSKNSQRSGVRGFRRQVNRGGQQQIDMIPKDFKQMRLDELIEHQNGILNLLDRSSNQIRGQTPKTATNHNPTFYERRAFVEIFRKKWKQVFTWIDILIAVNGSQKDMKNLLQNRSKEMYRPKSRGLKSRKASQEEQQMFPCSFNYQSESQTNLQLLSANINPNNDQILVSDESNLKIGARPRTESGNRKYKKSNLATKKNSTIQDQSCNTTPLQQRLQKSQKELEKMHSNIALSGQQALINIEGGMSAQESRKEVERILSSPKLIGSPSSNGDMMKNSYSNQQQSQNRTQDKRNRKLSQPAEMRNSDQMMLLMLTGDPREIVHQIRIDTPDSNSSKTLVRTFETVTTKNENLRHHPRYEGMGLQYNNNSITLEQQSILHMMRGHKYNESQNIQLIEENKDIRQLILTQPQFTQDPLLSQHLVNLNNRDSLESQIETGEQNVQLQPKQQLRSEDNNQRLQNLQFSSQIRESNPISPFLHMEQSHSQNHNASNQGQNSQANKGDYKQVAPKEHKLMVHEVKFNKSFNINLIRNRKELQRRQKLEQHQRASNNVNNTNSGQQQQTMAEPYIGPYKIRTDPVNSPSSGTNDTKHQNHSFNTQSGYINKQRKLRQKELIQTLINMNITHNLIKPQSASQKRPQSHYNQSERVRQQRKKGKSQFNNLTTSNALVPQDQNNILYIDQQDLQNKIQSQHAQQMFNIVMMREQMRNDNLQDTNATNSKINSDLDQI
ncbi:UNKNOWN [Stylonychia lemnae]|uniref:Uncharacterized protein n=1 Tax=Stylonychia lemnae TaxID=5949 RepID=A0A078B0Y3_STYLE|nr:UNKNOWN [Stylonychia lemnae]|eukprot:CDW88295.1 UNKNOWN [Stylonychia lemnae]